jgi:hypothetical protein
LPGIGVTVVLDEPHIVGGAVMGAAGVLLGTAARNPTIATSAFSGWNPLELLLIPAGIGPSMPFGLVSSPMGGADNVLVLAATSLLLACPAVLALVVGKRALPRDLT